MGRRKQKGSISTRPKPSKQPGARSVGTGNVQRSVRSMLSSDTTASPLATSVLDAVFLKSKGNFKPVVRGTSVTRDATGILAAKLGHYNRGTAEIFRRRVTVDIGTAGFGCLLINHKLTGLSQTDQTAGAVGTAGSDMAVSAPGNTLSSLNLNIFNPSVTNHAVGATPMMTMACSLGEIGPYAQYGSHDGEIGCVVLGQRITYEANRSAVTARTGAITVGSSFANMSLTTMNVDAFNADPRFITYDSAALDQEAKFTYFRPTAGLGTIVHGNTSSGVGGAGSWSQGLDMGMTYIPCKGASGDQYTFSIETIVGYIGRHVPLSIPFCFSSPAYNQVACAIARGMGGETSSDIRDAGKKHGQVKRSLTTAAAERTPNYVHDGLFEMATSMFSKKVLPQLLKTAKLIL